MSSELNIAENFKLPAEAVTQTFAILAKRGVGKTHTGCVMVEEMLAHGQQVVVTDPVGVWWGLRSSADGKSPGYEIVVFGGEHGDVPLDENAGEIVAQAVIEGGFSAVLDLSLFRKAAQNRFMLAFAETLYRLNRKPLHFMVDEADEFAPQKPLPGGERLLGAFEDIVRRGRARGLCVTLITQRAAVLNKNVLTQIEVLVVLRTISPQDRAAMLAWTKVHGSEEQQRELMESMASLPIGTAWFWSPGWLNIFRKIKVRLKQTFDSSATPKVGEVLKKPQRVAAVNLDALGERIKAAAELAKANDPAALKVEVARLKRELAKVPVAKTETKTVEVPVLKPSDLMIIQDGIAAAASVRGHLDKVEQQFAEVRKTIETELSNLKHLVVNAAKLAAPKSDFQNIGRLDFTPSRAFQVPRPMAKSLPQDNTQSGSTLSGGLKRMMIALAQRPGLTRRQLGVRAGLSSTSGTFANYLSKLRQSGLLEGSNEFQLTEAGLRELGSYEPLPAGEALLNYWLGELGNGGAARILHCLAMIYPKAISREELGAMTDMSASSGTFANYLSRLRTLELIEGSRDLKASAEFFQ